MNYLALYAGLLLPWIAGVLLLIAIERRLVASESPNFFRQAGYGFFLGYAGLFFLVKANHYLGGSVSWLGLMLVLALLTLGLAFLIWRTPAAIADAVPKDALHPKMGMTNYTLKQNKAILWLTIVLLGAIAVHLLIYTVDVFTQPVYPWDAWLAWVYRAKAWFLSGDMTTVISTADWFANIGTSSYTIDAWQYPTFPSVIPYWAALSLGRWSETLVNVPVLFAAIALGLALYGQCREYGLSVTASVLSCYLLYSIPLFGTHIALAGYADIWMAGFSGLGFVALMRALAQRSSQPSKPYGLQMALAFVLLTLAVMVKNEGAVWLLAAIGMLIILSYRARVPVLILVSAGLLVLFGFAFGITHVNLPLVGNIGFEDGRLMIPFIGNFSLELHNIWNAYLTNFFAMGSWNLFWVLVLGAVMLSMRRNDNHMDKRTQHIGLTFILIFLATQLFIFGLTDQGFWADTFTAINRLPLHFVPALLFAAFIIVDARLDKQYRL